MSAEEDEETVRRALEALRDRWGALRSWKMEVLRPETKLPAARVRAALRRMEARGEVASGIGHADGDRRRAWRLR